ncbi:hypothetical protein NCCP2716_17180 [Sporosarcina sp. NCCP-2716]|nr:hypothetical protein NCCP2716_17180 [Sporosarcina sp. NCCP-2716]
MLGHSKDVVYYFQLVPEERFLYLSPSLDRWLGRGTAEEGLRNPAKPFEHLHPQDFERLKRRVEDQLMDGEVLIQRWRDEHGVYRWFEEQLTPAYHGGQLTAVQGIMRNIDDRIERQRQLEYQATYDALTGVNNRSYFNMLMNRYDTEVDIPIGLIFCDVDELKRMNDRFGHAAGDELLKRTALFLQQWTSHEMSLARFGGDEFAIVVTGEAAYEQTVGLAAELEGSQSLLTDHNASESVRFSLGWTYNDHSYGNMGELFAQADARMYRNKLGKRVDGEGPIPEH